MTRQQLAMLHIAKGKLQMEEADYRTLLRNVGGLRGDKPSSKDLTQRGFEDVMAFFEENGATGGGTYWRDIISRRGRFADSRQIHLIRSLAAQQTYPIAALCRNASNHRAICPERLSPREAAGLIEMLKSVVGRQSAVGGQNTADCPLPTADSSHSQGRDTKECPDSGKEAPHGSGAPKDGR